MMGFKFGSGTIYRFTKGDGPTNMHKGSLAAIIAALRSLTGQDVTVCDLLDYVPE